MLRYTSIMFNDFIKIFPHYTSSRTWIQMVLHLRSFDLRPLGLRYSGILRTSSKLLLNVCIYAAMYVASPVALRLFHRINKSNELNNFSRYLILFLFSIKSIYNPIERLFVLVTSQRPPLLNVCSGRCVSLLKFPVCRHYYVLF